MSIYDEIASSQGVIYLDGPRTENLDRPVEFRSDQTVIFGRGCEFVVQFSDNRPAFQIHDQRDIVLRGNGTIIRRDTTTITAPQEHDHGISILGSGGVVVDGFDIGDVGGDAVYIGPKIGPNIPEWPSSEISITDVIARSPRRNGCSITYAADVTVKDFVTKEPGTASGNKGIVLEPNHSGQYLNRIRLLDCSTLRRAHGIHVQMAKGRNINATIQNCTAEVGGWAIRCTSAAGRSYDGKVTIIDCPGPYQVDWHGEAELRIL